SSIPTTPAPSTTSCPASSAGSSASPAPCRPTSTPTSTATAANRCGPASWPPAGGSGSRCGVSAPWPTAAPSTARPARASPIPKGSRSTPSSPSSTGSPPAPPNSAAIRGPTTSAGSTRCTGRSGPSSAGCCATPGSRRRWPAGASPSPPSRSAAPSRPRPPHDGGPHFRRIPTMSTVAVIGAKYVGATTAACLAWLGHDVTCADIDATRIDRLAAGQVPVLEEHLADLVAAGLAAGRLRFVTDSAAASGAADFVFLCVPTPAGATGAADLSAVDAVCRRIAPHLRPGAVVVNKSTMPVGSVRRVASALAEAGAVPGRYGVASNPEFLCEGRAVRNFLEPDRIVIGADDPAVAERVRRLYREIDAPVVVTDPESAEMIKYAANAYLATRVTFVNSIAALCEQVGADV